MTKIAAYDDEGIWGVGDTEEQARAEAEGFIKDNVPAESQQAEIDKLTFAPISDDLIALLVDDEGNASPTSKDDAPFVLDPDGTLIPDPENAGEEVEEDDDDDDGEEGVSASETTSDTPDPTDPNVTKSSAVHEEEDHTV